MTFPSVGDQTASASHQEAARATLHPDVPPLIKTRDPRDWNLTTCTALLALVAIWGIKVYSTWAAWGNLTIDCGHEMYVPAMLARGKVLYRDVWFLYGPAAPYLNSYLFRIFGPRLNVLYWLGSLAALGSAIFLYLTGMRLSSWVVGWAAGTALLLEAFEPSLFCFPLPYSYSTVYACLVGCLFLWIVVSASSRTGWTWMFGAATAAATALLLKPEFGMACYATLALLIAARCLSNRTWRPLGVGLAASLPGVLVCALVIRWMVSIAGVEFITQENIMSWPTSYFMRTYGKMWLETTGFTMSRLAMHDALLGSFPVAVAAMLVWAMLWWKKSDARSNLLRVMLALSLLALLLARHFHPQQSLAQTLQQMLAAILFPRDMVLFAALLAPVAWWRFLREPGAGRTPALALALSYSVLVSFRILTGMDASGYPIYYNGPVVLSFLALAFLLIPRSGYSRRFVSTAESAICLGCLSAVFLLARQQDSYARFYVPLRTERGTILTTQVKAENYEAAIRFMREKASLGESVLSIPEDTSLYFLSGTECPTRVFEFTPGILAPGKMTDETIQQIEHKHVRYLLWSNRTFPEYRTPVFGTDYDRPFGDYLRSHYRPVGRLLSGRPVMGEWTAVVWERKPEAETR